MQFQKSKKALMQGFTNNNFEELFKSKSKVSIKIDDCNNGTIINVAFPGYKTFYNKYGKLIHDYRVDTIKDGRKFSLSHVNIVTDIYNKIANGGADPQLLKDLIIMAFEEGFTCMKGYTNVLKYNPINPPAELLAQLHEIHKRVKVKTGDDPKKFNEPGNLEDLTPEELFVSIKWIALQEDINYPIRRNDNGELKLFGRIMPLMRYIEIIEVCENGTHSLEEVINRTLAHYKPDLWKEIDYDFIENIA